MKVLKRARATTESTLAGAENHTDGSIVAIPIVLRGPIRMKEQAAMVKGGRPFNRYPTMLTLVP